MTHDSNHPHFHNSAPNALASAISALRGLPFSDAWLRLVGSGAIEATPALGLVLLDVLPKLLVALGAGVLSHG
ncbi:MAG: hypothetical protein U1D06_05595 [Paracoccaceae bacterium]|nr:hypothetical protein [Paracoccaceae bacterium]